MLLRFDFVTVGSEEIVERGRFEGGSQHEALPGEELLLRFNDRVERLNALSKQGADVECHGFRTVLHRGNIAQAFG